MKVCMFVDPKACISLKSVLMSAEERNAENRCEKDRLLRQVIELKSAISAAVRKCNDLGITVDDKDPLQHCSDRQHTSMAGPTTTTTATSSTSQQPASLHKRALDELFEDGEEEGRPAEASEVNEPDREGKTKAHAAGDEHDGDEELEFEEESMIEAEGDDEEAGAPGDESFTAASPLPSRAAPSLSSPSPSPATSRRPTKRARKEDQVKVRERLRKKLGLTAKRRPPVVKPIKMSTHRPLVL